MKFSNPFKSRKKKQVAKKKSAKELATERGEPWVSILDMDIDYEDIASGSFELDWNDYFVTRLLKAGYKGKTDADIVDQWFQQVCRNVALETYEQEMADPERRKDLGDGKVEIS